MAKGFTDIAIRNLKPGDVRREIPDPGATGLFRSAIRQKVFCRALSLRRSTEKADAIHWRLDYEETYATRDEPISKSVSKTLDPL